MKNEGNLSDAIVNLTSKLEELCANINMLVGNSSKIFSELVRIKSGIDAIAHTQAVILNKLKINKSNK